MPRIRVRRLYRREELGMPAVVHRTVDVDGVRVFYREAGPAEAPVVLLPHGYPSSSFQYHALMPALADPSGFSWR